MRNLLEFILSGWWPFVGTVMLILLVIIWPLYIITRNKDKHFTVLQAALHRYVAAQFGCDRCDARLKA
jgi:membrane protein YdbS with pleckstrin-like domain